MISMSKSSQQRLNDVTDPLHGGRFRFVGCLVKEDDDDNLYRRIIILMACELLNVRSK